MKLKDIGTIITGNTPSKKNNEYYESNDILFVKPSDIEENYITSIEKSEEYISEKARKKARILPEGTVLVTCIGTIGKVGILNQEATCNQQINAIIPNDKVISKYLAYLIQSKQKILQLKANAPVVPIINKTDFSEIEIYICDINKQKEIVRQLDLLKTIIDKRKVQIEELQNIIKSQFVEMFENKNFDEKTLNEVSIIKGEYGSGASAGEFVEGQPRYVRITDIQDDGRLDKQSLASPKNENNIDKYILKYGDILFARTGATVGKTYKYNEKDGYCIYAGYCIRFRLDLQVCNPDYIFIFTKTEKYKKWVENRQRVVAQPNINAKEYGNDLKIPIPPIELQNKFAEFVKQIDKQKFESEIELRKIQKNIFYKWGR